jgi:hypothetical protein
LELRQGVSNAYYAVFHQLTGDCVEAVFETRPGSAQVRRAARRWLQHGDVRVLTEAALGRGNVAVVDSLQPVVPDVISVCRAFGNLQDARHAADYDHDYDVDKRTASPMWHWPSRLSGGRTA